MKREKFRRLLSIVLMVAMVFAMNVTAFAADTSSITIENAHAGQIYYIYKLFDATYDSSGNVAYTINTSTEKGQAWYSLVSAESSPFTVTATTTSGVYNVTVSSKVTANAITTWLASQTTLPEADYTVEVTSDGGKTQNVSGAGYYYITTTTGSLVTLDTATTSVAVRDKNSVPGVDKDVQEDSTGLYANSNTAGIGDKVYYTATISDAKDVESLTYHDVMSSGLTFNNDVTVEIIDSNGDTIQTLGSNTDYTVINSDLTDGCTFEVKFTKEGLEKVSSNSYKIVIAYSATVNSNAVIDNTGNTNTGSLSYGNNGESKGSTTTTYVYDLDIYKYTTTGGNTAETPLSGAKFVLYKTENSTTFYAVVSDGKLSNWVANKDSATSLISGEDGKISVDGLDAGTYYLEETEAPAGYNKLTSVITVVISEDGNVTYNGTPSSTGTVNVLNNAGSELPSTGGIGTTIFYIVGGVMVLGAAVLFVTKKRLSSED